MSLLEFGTKPASFRYAVIVCPKCRLNAQIIETGKKTMRCQRCSAILEIRRLRIFYSSEELAEAVTFRTLLQAEISGKGSETFSLKTSAEVHEPLNFEDEVTENIPEPTRARVSVKRLPKKSQNSMILELLEAAGGKMQIEELQQKAQEKGIIPEKFDLILKRLLEIGELYSPEPGIIKIL